MSFFTLYHNIGRMESLHFDDTTKIEMKICFIPQLESHIALSKSTRGE